MYNVAYILAFAASFCLLWSSWLAVFDTMSFIIFTFLTHISTNPAVTIYVVVGIGSVLFEFSRQIRRLGKSYTQLHDTVADLNDTGGVGLGRR